MANFDLHTLATLTREQFLLEGQHDGKSRNKRGFDSQGDGRSNNEDPQLTRLPKDFGHSDSVREAQAGPPGEESALPSLFFPFSFFALFFSIAIFAVFFTL